MAKKLNPVEAVPPAPIVPDEKVEPGKPLDGQPNDARVDQALGIFANLNALEVTPTSQIGAREILSCVPVRRPKNNEFVMVHPDPGYSLTTIVFEDKDEGETYFVAPEVRSLMIACTATKMLVLAVNQVGTSFIWPVPVDDEYSHKNNWNESARAGYHEAKKQKWVKLVGDRTAGQYRLYIAEGELPPPRWPDKSFAELLSIAFNNRKIDHVDHPIIRAMRGLTV
jgi:hypothetical protein